MGIETPRRTSLVPPSPGHRLEKELGVSTPRNTAHGHGDKTLPEDQPRRKATIRLTSDLAGLNNKRTREQLADDHSRQQLPPLHKREGAPLCEPEAPSIHGHGEQPSSKPLTVNTQVPIGCTAAELKNVVPHRKEFTDQKKQLGLGAWGLSLTVEGTSAAAATVVTPLVAAATVGAWASLTSLGVWVSNIYDRFEASGSRRLSKAEYEKALALRSKAMDDRVILAKNLSQEGKLEEGKALLDAAKEMIAMLDEILKGPEGYLAPAEAELRDKRRTLELQANDAHVEMIKVGPNDERYKQHEAKLIQLNERTSHMGTGKYERRKALQALKAKLPDLAEAEREAVEGDIERLERIAKQKKYPRVLRNPEHLGHRRVKLQRDESLVDIRLPPDIAATLVTFIGTILGAAATGIVAPAVTILLSPFWMRSARLDLEDAFRERRAADASLTKILDKLALGRAMQAHFDDLPPAQQNDPQTRLGKSIARNLIAASLREYKQAMRLKKLADKKEQKGAGLRYVAIPSVVVLAAATIVGVVLGVTTMGIGFGVAASVTAIGVGAYYLHLSKLKKKAKEDKHEAKRRQAAALWVKNQMGDVRGLFTCDSDTAKGIVSDLWRHAPDTLRPYIDVGPLLNNNEHLLCMALSDEYTNAPIGPEVAPGNKPFAVQMSKPLGLSDNRSNFLLHNGPLLEGAKQQGHVALTTLAPLFAAKVYDADRLPAYPAQEATDDQLEHAVDVLNDLAASPEHQALVQLIAQQDGSPEAIKQWARQNPQNARFMREAVANLRNALIGHGVALTHLAELQDRPVPQGLLSVLLDWEDAALQGTPDAAAFPDRPPIGVSQFEEAIRKLGMAQKSGRQQKRLEAGQQLLAGGGIRTPRQWLKYFDKKPNEKAIQIGNLVSMWRDTLPRNAQGQIDVPDGHADEDAYLVHLMKETIVQYQSLRDSVSTHDAHEHSRMFATLQARFDDSRQLAADCVEHLANKHLKARRDARASSEQPWQVGAASLAIPV
ncbi:MAG: hypothetical protein GTN84_09705 [Hydrogenophaga sp.]|uniref:hypothetical protein n=1 Tax=Hydrogenophaga sp. TaxID=1904254 RepID=UPI0016AB6B1D|nr:hypothetical protein [Hydrogenophaga sp.]NIM41367.1 hypothetical protein [Hydrogenophaga sp.]NIN26683.1 hypothetical protein [Hydrogenophaga sp.]NIN30005.1 hypothetical protein [Hydrogenophaga sp.]NIN55613.1 hypothetical protein [Hydrogenophaga sp.]NIO52610.1 hypothetical protein [Hydrogenophaga sp.]